MSGEDSKISALITEEPNGILRESMTNSRIILFSCSAYRSMCDSLFEQFQSGSGIILYRMGQGYARKLVEGVSNLNFPLEDTIKIYQKLSLAAGWGNVKIKVIEGQVPECTLHHSAFVLRRKNAGTTTCYFFAGALSTIASSLVKKEMVAVKEVECEAGGFEHCRFIINV